MLIFKVEEWGWDWDWDWGWGWGWDWGWGNKIEETRLRKQDWEEKIDRIEKNLQTMNNSHTLKNRNR